MNQKIIALLPMKGNSERVPNKNLRDFNGSPLYTVIADKLLKSRLINKIIVNTDSQNIINDIKSRYGQKITIRLRPESIQGDFISMNKIIKDDLKNSDGDIYLQTHSTNPLLNIDSIDNALSKMIYFNTTNKYYDSLFSVTKIQTRFYDINGNPINHDPNELVRTQDLPPIFEENSSFFVFTKSSFKNSNNKRIGVNPRMFEINKVEAIDIDNIEDFIIAEAIHKSRKINENN